MTDKKLTVENFKKAEEKERRLLEDYGYKALSIERLRHREMMTNKEQIIINGINIFDTLDEWADLISQNWCSAEYQTAEIIKNHILGINKQLARKTQECEELKEKLKTAENDAIVRFVEKNIQCVSPTNCRFVNLCKQECEKKQNIIEELEKKLKEISANYIEDEARYRKALEEIEGIAKNFGSYAAWQEQRINKILDIINKVKGEDNGINDNSK